jgi:ATP-dependent exoDNAse (exonuclease V) beta subunit
VYLFPDLSTSGYECWAGKRPDRDSVRRLMYVGMTRAKESLVICEPYKAKHSVDGL